MDCKNFEDKKWDGGNNVKELKRITLKIAIKISPINENMF